MLGMKNRVRIHRVSPERLREIIQSFSPRKCFLAKEEQKWVAVDNSTGDAWTEEFSSKRQAVRWLRGEFEVGLAAKEWTRIGTPKQLIDIAEQQGMALGTETADMILGYLDGHDFCLMTDSSGMTVLHDEQYQNIHRGDDPYTVLDAVEFCQEMNEDLLVYAEAQCKDAAEYLSRLQRDEQLLTALMARPADNAETGS